jgi:signal peptidase I
MKRLALAAMLVIGLVACGSGSPTSTVALYNPSTSGLSLDVTGSAQAAPAVADELEQLSDGVLATASGDGGADGSKRDCTRTIPIVTYPVTKPSLRGLGGQKITLAIYGDSALAAATCQQLPSEFPDGVPVVGGNRRIYREPSSAMEPTLHCAKASGAGCRGSVADVLVAPLTGSKRIQREDIVVFNTPPPATSACGEGGVFVKRVIGLPGETVREDGHGLLSVRSPGSATWTKLSEPYVSAATRAEDAQHFDKQWNVPAGDYFVVGDNRSASCDSRAWGSVPAAYIIGPVTQIIRGGKALTPAGIPG